MNSQPVPLIKKLKICPNQLDFLRSKYHPNNPKCWLVGKKESKNYAIINAGDKMLVKKNLQDIEFVEGLVKAFSIDDDWGYKYTVEIDGKTSLKFPDDFEHV